MAIYRYTGLNIVPRLFFVTQHYTQHSLTECSPLHGAVACLAFFIACLVPHTGFLVHSISRPSDAWLHLVSPSNGWSVPACFQPHYGMVDDLLIPKTHRQYCLKLEQSPLKVASYNSCFDPHWVYFDWFLWRVLHGPSKWLWNLSLLSEQIVILRSWNR